jgi:hypothetical protein
MMRDDKTWTRPGYWCEERVHTPTSEFGTRTVSAWKALTASEAITWVYIALRIHVQSLPEDELSARAWLEHGRHQSLRGLMNGEPFSFSISEGQTRVELMIRRVIFLPLSRCHLDHSDHHYP